MRNNHVFADRLDVADFIPDVRLRSLSLLEPDVNRMKVLVPLDQRTEGASPHNVSCELTIQHVGIPLIVPGLQPRRELLCRVPRLGVVDGEGGAAGCISVLLHKVFIPGDSREYPHVRCSSGPRNRSRGPSPGGQGPPLMLLTETEGMAGRVGVDDPGAAWLFDRSGERHCTELGCPETGGAEVGNHEVEMELLRRATRPFRRGVRPCQLEGQLE
jgi:hypothetical protein